jgi:hypothetical protein
MSILKLERSVDEFIQFKHGLLPVSIFLMIAKAKTPMTYKEIGEKLNVSTARASRNLSILLKLNLIEWTKIEPVEKKPVRKIFFGLIHIGGSFSITQFSLSKDGLKLKKNLEKIWAS